MDDNYHLRRNNDDRNFLNFISSINLWASAINTKTLEFYKIVSTVLVAIIAAIIASVIQWRQSTIAHNQWLTAQQQAKIAKKKLQFELFEKRFEVYECMGKYVTSLLINDHSHTNYLTFFVQSEWLFDEEIGNYLTKEFGFSAARYAGKIGSLRQNNEPEDSPEFGFAMDDLNERLKNDFVKRRKLFGPYLKIETD